VRAARAGAAAVWWYQGLWCKVLRRRPEQRSIVAAVPGLPAGWAGGALATLGVLETAVGGWVASGLRPRQAALVQTGLLVAVNAGGLAFGRAHIRAPGRLLARNAALLAAVWAAGRRSADG
jgi:uncharacterized membrane protein YphA (DoxX/SURF4 family)